MRTLIAAAGQEAGDATAVDVSDEQWPAVSTVSGEMSVPVHWNSRPMPKPIWATAGNSPELRSSRPRWRRTEQRLWSARRR